MPSAEPWPAGLTTIGNVEPLLDRRQRARRAQLLERGLGEGVEVGRRDARVAQRVLGHDLVHAADAGAGPRGRVGDADELEQLLDGPVLAAAAVQRDERDVRALRLQAVDEVGADVDRQHVVAEPRQRVLDPGARAQRDRPLQRGRRP